MSGQVTRSRIEPHLLAILGNRVNSIARHMTHVLTRSARSSVMSAARDLSTAICDRNGDALALPNGFPVHVANMSLVAKSVLELHGHDMRPGDAFLHNSPYHGNTHMADHTIVVPVFHEDELLFLCACRGHQADIGNGVPTTYNVRARDIYEEGALCFPGVRVQQDYRDVDDIIRMAKMRIRVPDVWYGDYLAAIGAARIGERSLLELVERHGRETIEAFCAEWQEYGSRKMADAIGKLPAGRWSNSSRHDGIPGLLDGGVTVGVEVTIIPDQGRVVVDFRDNADPVACGLNLCEATVLSAGRTGIMNRMPTDVPLCEGAFDRIEVRMREAGVVGKASLPYSSSVATTNVADHAILAVQGVWSQVDYELGMAEGAEANGVENGVISGYDSAHDRHYVTQIIAGGTGGMGVFGHDGWVDYAISNGSMEEWNAIEVVEQKYPILYLQQELIPDSMGAGRWDGAPGCRTMIAAVSDPVTFMYLGDNQETHPRGANGGGDGSGQRAAIVDWRDLLADEQELPLFNSVTLQPGQAIIGMTSSGGGYGDPLERDPEAIRHRVREGWLSRSRAREVYGVVLEESSDCEIDVDATARERGRRPVGHVAQGVCR